MKKRTCILAAVAALCFVSGFAQARKGLRINEVMVVNETNLVDDYGNHGAWIELFNSNFAPLQISNVFLTTDSTKPKMYPVPLGDEKTKVGKRQHVLFWADGMPSRGTFHTSLILDATQPNWIGVYDADGITLIDSVTVPVIAANSSYARREDGKGTGAEAWMVRDGSEGSHITPSSANVIKDTNHQVDMFHEIDENGFGMTITAMGVVFTALLLLCICFYIINRIGASRLQRNKMEAHGISPVNTSAKERPDGDTGEVIAAICMALNEHLNAHDLESTILTINRGRKTYSPWNSHIYTLRQNPRR